MPWVLTVPHSEHRGSAGLRENLGREPIGSEFLSTVSGGTRWQIIGTQNTLVETEMICSVFRKIWALSLTQRARHNRGLGHLHMCGGTVPVRPQLPQPVAITAAASQKAGGVHADSTPAKLSTGLFFSPGDPGVHS